LGFRSHSYSDEIPIYDEPRIKGAIIELGHLLEAQKTKLGIPGLAGALVYDQKIIWSNGFGQADIATNIPVTPKTIFRVGSITKLFTATMLMQIRDQGELCRVTVH